MTPDPSKAYHIHVLCFLQSSKQREGRVERSTTPKGLLHSNDHIKEKASTEGEVPPTYPGLFWGNTAYIIMFKI